MRVGKEGHPGKGNSWSEDTKRGKWRSSKYAIHVGVVNPQIQEKVEEAGLSFEELELAQSVADRAHDSGISEGLCSSGKVHQVLRIGAKYHVSHTHVLLFLLICLSAFVTGKIQIHSRGWMNSWPCSSFSQRVETKAQLLSGEESLLWKGLKLLLAPVSSFYRQMNKGVVKRSGFAEDRPGLESRLTTYQLVTLRKLLSLSQPLFSFKFVK